MAHVRARPAPSAGGVLVRAWEGGDGVTRDLDGRGLTAPIRALHQGLDRVAGAPIDGVEGRAVPSGGALRGDWFGHAIHPVLTDFTNGPWMAASFLDLFGPVGSAAAARRLVAFGLVSSAPTILTGLADWATSRGRERRVGVVHALSSSIATALYGASYVARRRGRQRTGVLLGVLGGTVAFVDGYVGGELSLVGGVGTGRRRPTA